MTGGIGLFGGTFDPVHFGHLRAAEEAAEQLALNEFRLLPAGNPPHRPATHAGAADRLAMLQQAIANHPTFIADDREVRRPGKSFMVDTLGELRAEAGDTVPLVLLIGQDAANALDGWHRWRELFDLAHLCVMRRPDSRSAYSADLADCIRGREAAGVQDLSGAPAGRVLPLEVTQLAISGTDIRRRISSGRSIRYLVPEEVRRYIAEKQLYTH